jgi:SAM-dependent methyltransferase
MGTAAHQWAEQLRGWAIPPHILRLAPESPWGFPSALFPAPAEPVDSPARRFALAYLGDGGSVLDVGCGGGTAAFALVPPATRVTGVDESADALAGFAARAAELGVACATVQGSWPFVATDVADVAVCHHMAYNVADLRGAVVALTGAARRGVVMEVGAKHPLTFLAPLWKHFWGIDRPSGPVAEDVVAVVRECGLEPSVDTSLDVPAHALTFAERVALTRRRLCLPASRDDEVAAALSELPDAPREVWAIAWSGDA